MYKQPRDSCPLNSKSIFHQLPLHSQRNYFPAHAATVFLYDLKSQTTVMTFNQIGDTWIKPSIAHFIKNIFQTT